MSPCRLQERVQTSVAAHQLTWVVFTSRACCCNRMSYCKSDLPCYVMASMPASPSATAQAVCTSQAAWAYRACASTFRVCVPHLQTPCHVAIAVHRATSVCVEYAGMGLRLATYYRRASPSDTRHRDLSAPSMP